MQSAPLTDEELMAAYLCGERAAFRALFDRYSPRLMGYFVRTVGRREIAADLVQQTFLQLHRARADFRPGARVSPWLWTIARNVGRMYLRGQARRPEAQFDPDRHGEPSTAPRVSSPTDRLVRRALSELNPGQREVVVLHWYEGLAFREIAEVVGASTSAVKLRAHRAYAKLRERLREPA